MKAVSLLLSILTFLMTFSPSFVNASMTQESEEKSQEAISEILYNPEDYIKWIRSLNDEGTEEFLRGFLSLSEDEQHLFLRIMHPDNFSEMMSVSDNEIGANGTVLIDNEEVSFSVVDSYEAMLETNTPITITVTESYSSSLSRNAGDRYFTRTYSSTLLGLTVTSFTSTFRFRINTATLNPTNALGVTASHINRNPGIIVSNLRTTHHMFGGRAYGYATWRVSATAGLGMIAHDNSLQLRRNGQANQSRIQGAGNNSTNW